MSRNDFYKGWSIMIFDIGMPGDSPRTMMAVKGGSTIDFPGYVNDDDKALEYAKNYIDSLGEETK